MVDDARWPGRLSTNGHVEGLKTRPQIFYENRQSGTHPRRRNRDIWESDWVWQCEEQLGMTVLFEEFISRLSLVEISARMQNWHTSITSCSWAIEMLAIHLHLTLDNLARIILLIGLELVMSEGYIKPRPWLPVECITSHCDGICCCLIVQHRGWLL